MKKTFKYAATEAKLVTYSRCDGNTIEVSDEELTPIKPDDNSCWQLISAVVHNDRVIWFWQLEM